MLWVAFIRDSRTGFQPIKQIPITHQLHDRIANRFRGYLRENKARHVVFHNLTAMR